MTLLWIYSKKKFFFLNDELCVEYQIESIKCHHNSFAEYIRDKLYSTQQSQEIIDKINKVQLTFVIIIFIEITY